jgi:metallophosphoesterase (TIGR03767 family)
MNGGDPIPDAQDEGWTGEGWTTVDRVIVGGMCTAQGYWNLAPDEGEPWCVRMPGAQVSGPDAFVDPSAWEPLLAIAHLSDLHVCDSQSPARVEMLDRFAHPLTGIRSSLDDEGRAYRPQEPATTQVLDAMVHAVNALSAAPFSDRPIDVAVMTGDTTDNAQGNELQWLLDTLAGRRVTPDSGDPTTYEGVGSTQWFDPAYWHPDGAPEGCDDDIPTAHNGFPRAPGFLDAARRPFAAEGLRVPWLAVYGNHDALIQGTAAIDDGSIDHATGSLKAYSLDAGVDPQAGRDLLDGIVDERTVAVLTAAATRTVTPDPQRRPLSRLDHVRAHLADGGHGFTARNAAEATAYYRHDIGAVTILVLDTVVEHGGWQGSLDEVQVAWLSAELTATSDRYVLLASHHTAADLVNDTAPPGAARRVLRAEVMGVLLDHANVIAWINGHTHRTRITYHGEPARGFWEITAPSLIDWPQQGRMIEVLRHGADLAIACTMLDHAGVVSGRWDFRPSAVDDQADVGVRRTLAGLSRELSANAWAAPPGPHAPGAHPLRGTPADRNALLLLPDRA